jgi:hypothetical protein
MQKKKADGVPSPPGAARRAGATRVGKLLAQLSQLGGYAAGK